MVAQHPETMPLHALKLLLRAFLLGPGAAPAGRPLVLMGDGEGPRQQQGGPLGADPFQTGNKVDHIAGGPAAETVKAPVGGFRIQFWVWGRRGLLAAPWWVVFGFLFLAG